MPLVNGVAATNAASGGHVHSSFIPAGMLQPPAEIAAQKTTVCISNRIIDPRASRRLRLRAQYQRLAH